MAQVFESTTANDTTIIRGPGRLMYASISTPFPTTINDVVNISSYQAMSGWFDFGATKGGITINFNNAEESLDVDQILGAIKTLPTDSTMTVDTALSEATLDHLSLAWEGDVVGSQAGAGGTTEKTSSFGPFQSYTTRRLALGFRNASTSKLKLYAFRIAQRAPAASALTFNKTGDQQTIPVSFRILPDTSVSNVLQRYMTVFEQI